MATDANSDDSFVDFGKRPEIAKQMRLAIEKWTITLAAAVEMGDHRNTEATLTYKPMLEIHIASFIGSLHSLRCIHVASDKGPSLMHITRSSNGVYLWLNGAVSEAYHCCWITQNDLSYAGFRWSILHNKTFKKLRYASTLLDQFLRIVDQHENQISASEAMERDFLKRAEENKHSLPLITIPMLMKFFFGDKNTIRKHLADAGVKPTIEGKPDYFPKDEAIRVCRAKTIEKVDFELIELLKKQS